MGRTGTEFAALLKDLRGDARQKAILQAWKNGEVPSWITKRAWPIVEASAVIDGVKRVLRYPVMPDRLSLGTDEDPLAVGLTPSYAQVVADDLYAVIPTRRMSRAIWGAAPVKILYATPGYPYYLPGGIPGDISATGAWVDQNKKVQAQQVAAGNASRGQLSSGGWKLVVLYRGIPSTALAIDGGKNDANPATPFVQKDYGPHSANYDPDYAQGLQAASRKGMLSDALDPTSFASVDLKTVAADPKLNILLNEDGPIDLTFPNTIIPGGGPASGKPASTPTTKAPPYGTPSGITSKPKPAIDLMKPAESSGETSFLLLGIFGAGLLAMKLVGK